MADFTKIGDKLLQILGQGQTSPGLLGYTINGVFRVVVPENPKQFYVRFENGTFCAAINQFGVAQKQNMPVIVGVNKIGQPIILGTDPDKIDKFLTTTDTGSNVPIHGHQRNGGMDYIIDSWLIKQQRMTVSSGMNVNVAAGPYQWRGTLRWFQANSIDLSSFAPIDIGTQCWIVVGINPDTESLVAMSGVETPTNENLDLSMIADIPFVNQGYIPIAAIYIKNSDVDLVGQNYRIEDLRFMNGSFITHLEDLLNVADNYTYYGYGLQYGYDGYWGAAPVVSGSESGGATSLSDLTDVDVVSTPPTDQQALIWNDATSNWIPGDVATGGGGGEPPKLLVDYAETTDIATGLSIPASTWTDVGPELSFTVLADDAFILITVSGSIVVGGASTEAISRLVVDSAGTPIYKHLGGGNVQGSAMYPNVLGGAGAVGFANLSPGVHTAKVQVFSGNAATAYCRTVGDRETFQIQVVEFGGGGISKTRGVYTRVYREKLVSDSPSMTTGVIDLAEYEHVRVRVLSARSTYSAFGATLYIAFNGDTTDANYTSWGMYGGAGGAGGYVSDNQRYLMDVPAANGDAGNRGDGEWLISEPGESGDRNKMLLSLGMVGPYKTNDGYVEQISTQWNNTSAITEISIDTGGFNDIVAGTILEVYGFKIENIGSGIANLDAKLTTLTSTINTTSTSRVPIDATNMGYTQHGGYDLQVGDMVECVLSAQLYNNSGANYGEIDLEIDQPISGDVYAAPNYSWLDYLDGSRRGRTIIITFTATEAGIHAFRPVWQTSGGQFETDGASTPIQFSTKRVK